LKKTAKKNNLLENRALYKIIMKSLSKKILTSLSLLLICGIVGSAQEQDCGKTDYECQVAKATKQISASPTDSEPYYARGRAFSFLQKNDQAIADLTKYINSNPKKEYLADGYNERAVSYKQKGQYSQALSDYTTAINLVPNKVLFLSNRGRLYNIQKAWDLAIPDLNKVVTLEPDRAGTYVDRGRGYMGKKDYVSALADFDAAIKLDPNDAEAYYNSSIIYAARNEYERAIEGYDKYISLNTTNIPYLSDGYQNRALVYAALGNYDRALKDLQTAIDLDPKDPSPYRSRAALYRKQGKTALAEVDERKAASLKK